MNGRADDHADEHGNEDRFPVVPGLGNHRPEQLLAALKRHPAVTLLWQAFANSLLEGGALAARDRELLVLRTAYVRRNAYIWGGHVLAATAAGLTDSDVGRIAAGASAPGWSVRDRALLGAVDDLIRGGVLSGTTRAALGAALDERQRLEVPMVVGNYVLVSMIVDALGLVPEPWSIPLPANERPE